MNNEAFELWWTEEGQDTSDIDPKIAAHIAWLKGAQQGATHLMGAFQSPTSMMVAKTVEEIRSGLSSKEKP